MTRPKLKHGYSAIATIAACTLLNGMAWAADYPARPVRMIVPFASGSATDTSARIYANELSKQMGQQVIADNRPGAGGAIGMQMLAKAVADGYTIAYAGAGPLAINRSVTPNLPYDVEKDFLPVSQAVTAPMMLAVSPTLPAKTVKDLIALAKSRPDDLSNGSAGTGTIGHLAGEYFKMQSGTRILHVPYKGGGQAAIDVMSGQVQLMFDPINGVSPHVRSGKLRGLAVTSRNRAKAFPAIPAVAETIKDFEVTTWGGIVAPAGIPKPALTRLNAEMQKAVKSPTVIERYGALGADPVASTPEQFAALIRNETVKWAEVVKRAMPAK
jgi:tripartite-type tricarboxylate transporter receptor subunit TctC